MRTSFKSSLLQVVFVVIIAMTIVSRIFGDKKTQVSAGLLEETKMSFVQSFTKSKPRTLVLWKFCGFSRSFDKWKVQWKVRLLRMSDQTKVEWKSLLKKMFCQKTVFSKWKWKFGPLKLSNQNAVFWKNSFFKMWN